MQCPVCNRDNIRLREHAVLIRHTDTLGKPCPMSGRMAYEWDEEGTREAVANRSGGVCEYCHAGRATEMHHRKSRGVGGKWHPANIMHLCSRDHRYFTDHPADGYALGVCVRRADDPNDMVVTTYDGQVVWFSDDVTPPA